MEREKLVCAPVRATEEETWEAAENIMRIIDNSGPLHEALNIIRYNGFYLKKNLRSIKTHWCCQLQGDNPLLFLKFYYVVNGFNKKVSNRKIKYGCFPFLNC